MHEIVKIDKPVLLDFWAPWCGPCKILLPIIDELSKEYGDKIQVRKINLDLPESRELATIFQVRTVPTLLLFKSGVFFKQIPHGADKTGIRAAIDQCLEFRPSIF